VLASSFKAHNPGGVMSVLVIDDVYGEVRSAGEPFEVVHVHDLDEPSSELSHMAAIYEVTEFATSLKPWLLEHLLDEGATSVIYLDPDIQVFDGLGELASAARDSNVVITPHARAPFPRDNKMTDEKAILAVGVYNLGFIAVGQGSRPFLEYWKERLRRECRNDTGNMRFVDQRWVDFVPAMFDCEIVREPRFNVAYWNLHEREVAWTGEGYEVDNKPLGFFHFSGYSPAARHVLSRHQVERPRILLSEHPDLARIVNEYGDALESAGYGDDADRALAEYGLSRAVNGLVLDRHVRKLYLERLLAWDEGQGDEPPDPFDASGAAALLRWLNSIVPSEVGPSRLTLYQATLYAYSPELHAVFPDPQGADFDGFQNWFNLEAAQGRIDPLLVPADLPPLEDPHLATLQWAPRDSLRPGLNVAGYLDSSHSIGESARLTTATVAASGIPFQSVVYGAGRMSLATSTQSSAPRDDYDTNLVVVNADQFADFVRCAGAAFFDGRYTIAQWAWELEVFPARWHDAFARVDEIWALSEFSRASIQSATEKPVFAAPLAVLAPDTAPGVGRAELGLPEDRYVFLFCLDLHSVVERKNPVGAIEAFKRAFSPGEGPLLVIKTVNGDSREMDLELVRYAARDRPDVIVTDGHLPRAEQGSLMAASDCYVSLHRSEGFGLTMAEAMALGKPVIATAYSGNLEFMNDDNSFLVPFSWTQVPAGAGPYPAGARWADPDVAAAASFMRTVVESTDVASSTAARGREDMLSHHGLEARSRFVRNRLEAIEDARPDRGHRRRRGSPKTKIRRPSSAAASQPGVSTVLRAVQLLAGGGIGAAQVTNSGGGEMSRLEPGDIYRRVMNRVAGTARPSGHEAELRHALDDLAQRVSELRGLCIAAHVRQSELDAERERATRDIGLRLEAIERRLGSLQKDPGVAERHMEEP
jgi:glycosyltransferase involved in cell wall biosynthesis